MLELRRRATEDVLDALVEGGARVLGDGKPKTGAHGLPVLFLLLDAFGKFAKPEQVVTGTTELGYSESVILPLGITLLALLVPPVRLPGVTASSSRPPTPRAEVAIAATRA